MDIEYFCNLRPKGPACLSQSLHGRDQKASEKNSASRFHTVFKSGTSFLTVLPSYNSQIYYRKSYLRSIHSSIHSFPFSSLPSSSLSLRRKLQTRAVRGCRGCCEWGSMTWWQSQESVSRVEAHRAGRRLSLTLWAAPVPFLSDGSAARGTWLSPAASLLPCALRCYHCLYQISPVRAGVAMAQGLGEGAHTMCLLRAAPRGQPGRMLASRTEALSPVGLGFCPTTPALSWPGRPSLCTWHQNGRTQSVWERPVSVISSSHECEGFLFSGRNAYSATQRPL